MNKKFNLTKLKITPNGPIVILLTDKILLIYRKPRRRNSLYEELP